MTYQLVQHALTALGDPTRRAIFESVAMKPMPVQELANAHPVSRPAVSQHLKVLKDAGLVTATANGTRRFYRAAPEGVAAMREYFDVMWDKALAAFAVAVEEDTNQEGSVE